MCAAAGPPRVRTNTREWTEFLVGPRTIDYCRWYYSLSTTSAPPPLPRVFPTAYLSVSIFFFGHRHFHRPLVRAQRYYFHSVGYRRACTIPLRNAARTHSVASVYMRARACITNAADIREFVWKTRDSDSTARYLYPFRES